MTIMRDVKERLGAGVIDPIDALVPRPRPFAVRLAIGAAVVGLVGCGAWLFGSGSVYPQPDCCGSTGGDAQMSLTDARDAVQISMLVGNSSRSRVRIDGGRAVLPGAEVVDVGAVAWGPSLGFRVPFQPQPFPAPIDANGALRVIVTFVPTSCEPATIRAVDGNAWGELWLDLEVDDNGPLPSFGRRYRVPGHVVEAGQRSLSLFASDDGPSPRADHPLAAACELLGR
jgi:hypothetical protein